MKQLPETCTLLQTLMCRINDIIRNVLSNSRSVVVQKLVILATLESLMQMLNKNSLAGIVLKRLDQGKIIQQELLVTYVEVALDQFASFDQKQSHLKKMQCCYKDTCPSFSAILFMMVNHF